MALVALLIIMGGIFIIIIFLKFHEKGRGRGRFMASIDGKHVLITGGSSGIGLAIAKRCVQEGAYVTLLARNEANLIKARDSLLEFCAGDSGRILTKSADASDGKEVGSAIEESFTWRPIDILICSAGVVKISFFEDMSIKDLETIASTNFMGTLYTVHAALPFLKDRSQTHPCAIVFINSLAAINVLPGMNLYVAAKHAQKGLAELLRLEMLPYNIRICSVLPGFTDTPLFYEGNELASTSETLRNVFGFIKEWFLQTPDEVAAKTIEGMKRGEFLITTMWDGFLLGVLGRGNVPAESVSRAVLELLLLLPARIGSFIVFYCGKQLVKKMHGEHTAYRMLKNSRK